MKNLLARNRGEGDTPITPKTQPTSEPEIEEVEQSTQLEPEVEETEVWSADEYQPRTSAHLRGKTTLSGAAPS